MNFTKKNKINRISFVNKFVFESKILQLTIKFDVCYCEGGGGAGCTFKRMQTFLQL